MFLKPFRIKSNTQLRNSERKRFRATLLKLFPLLTENDVDDLVPQDKVFALIKLIAHGGQIVLVYMVDVPVAFELEQVVYPTVYMLWRVPHIIPTLTMWPQIFEKISKGADLMMPGIVVQGPLHKDSYGCFEVGYVVAINTTTNKAPVAVGTASMSSHQMYLSSQYGKAVKVLHSFGDKLWEYGSKMELPKLGPPSGYGGDSGLSSTEVDSDSSRRDGSLSSAGIESTDSGLQNSSLSAKDSDETVLSGLESESSKFEETDEEKESSLGNIPLDVSDKLHSLNLENNENDAQEKALEESASDEMDKLLEYTFLKGIKMAVKKVELPLLASSFYKIYMIPASPLGSQVDVKKSSFKKLSVFLNTMEKNGIIKIKELNKGVKSIVFIDEKHKMLKDFVDIEPSQESKTVPGVTKPTIMELYKVTAAVLPVLSTFGLRRGDMIPMTDLRRYITTYVKREKLQDPDEKNMVSVNEALQGIVQDPNTLSVTWEDLMGLFITHMSHGYMMKGPFSEKSVTHKGKLEPIDIQISRRTGNKKVTLINNLELYGIDIQEFGRECQRGVAASTSVSAVPGRKSSQLLVQGNQTNFVANLLTNRYNIPKRYIRGLENAPRPKK